MKSIVVGYDGTDSAARALERAAGLAEALRARLVVTSVATPPVPGPGLAAALPTAPAQFAAAGTEELERAESDLEDARSRLAGRALEADYVREVGNPADRIVALAEERHADLIVVGTREPGFLERLLQGSVSEDVSRQAHRDVLIVH